ncbi:MAG TPA: glycoside hydrolase family 5 protein [Cytophagaceae bacterium]|jgi:aryl-phospho-beta-D-glucosidase BglC (GH1 family)|nr:glycoside hydrolase family 5 protein [Cytophagaceae bacterium]
MKLLLKGVCTALASVFFCVGSFVYGQSFVSVKGKDIVDPQGNKIILKGTNLGNWLVPEGYMFKFGDVNSPAAIDKVFRELIGPEETVKFWNKYLDAYITEEDILYIKKTGANHIRLPFHYKLFTSEDYLNGENKGFLYMDRVVNWCTKAGLWVQLDMHCAPGGQTGDNIDDSEGYPFLFESDSAQKQTIEIWRKIAARYKDNTTVLGYDLLNEPIAHYFSNKEELNKKLEPLYKQIVAAIRESDKNHLIFLGGAQWDTNFGVFGAPFDSKLVYTFHKYWMPVTEGEIMSYLEFRKKYNVPLYLGESGENTDEWVNSFRELLEKNEISWCFWPYKKMKNTKGVMNFKEPESYPLIVSYAVCDRSRYSNIRSHRPDIAKVKIALNEFVENSKFKNCFPNEGYVKALGLKP